MTQPKINGTAVEKLEYLRKRCDFCVDKNGNGRLFVDEYAQYEVVLGKDGGWWIE